MKYKEALYHLYVNNKLNEAGLSNYISILLKELSEEKIKIVDLENQLQRLKSEIEQKKK